jgi:2-C-methyl-D-erythritol 4-phosphate cytidylyltransferase/2-C-methyl-D-erythritol 2,4-cyclodiphosphate synthase
VKVAAIVAAGGQGQRLGAGQPKQFLEIGGRSLLQRSVEALLGTGLVADVVIVVPADHVDRVVGASWIDRARMRVVAGGARRQDSVACGFDAVPQDADVVLVHDAARPFVSRDVVARAVAAAAAHGAAIAAVRARDTVKQAVVEAGRDVVRGTLPRDEIFLAQTPQAFRRAALEAAIRVGRLGAQATDEAALAELAGQPVTLVEGDALNMKITTEADLRVARALAAAESPGGGSAAPQEPARPVRVGTGYDLHRFAPGRPLVLGGVRIPSDVGLAGHSDADAIAHALTDAILGAAALGDIGQLFPDTDARWKDADSLMMLRAAVDRVREAGHVVGNVDVTVIAERPKIGPHRDAIRASLARALGIDLRQVSVKGKTNEGVDAVGRGEALAVHAVALLTR